MKDFDEFLALISSEEYQEKMAQALRTSCEIEQDKLGREMKSDEITQTMSKAYTVNLLHLYHAWVNSQI